MDEGALVAAAARATVRAFNQLVIRYQVSPTIWPTVSWGMRMQHPTPPRMHSVGL